jgi:probable S-adenosylmethionine-dependent methyltransferase, YraL family
MAKLFVVPTPIGNLEDITLRALRILKEVDFILAEDTRTTGLLLKHFDIRKKMFSHHKFNEHQTVNAVVSRILSGEKAAVVSDAGTPGISDPGFLLVRECIARGIEVECLPGPAALIPALVNSGFPTDRFCFEGFLPPKKGRQSRMQLLAEEERTVVIYESPYRVLKTLTQLMEHMGEERTVSVSREISKLYEETIRGTLKEVISHFTVNEPKGEFVIVIAGKEKPEKVRGIKNITKS